MQPLDIMFQFPADLELWIILVYVAAVVIGARVIEILARMHLARAARHAEEGFEYLADQDRYRCAGGEHLALHRQEPERQLAIYHATPEQCHTCRLKESCAPHGTGRRVYRSLATWAESDLGKFHQRVSLLMFSAGGLLTAVALFKFTGRPGTGYLLIGLFSTAASTFWDLWPAAFRTEEPSRAATAGEPSPLPHK